MRSTILRTLTVSVSCVVLMEILFQLTVHARESTEELSFLSLLLLVGIGLIWASLPAFSKVPSRAGRMLCRALLVSAAFTGLYTAVYFYS